MFDFLGTGHIELKDVEKCIKQLPLPEKIKSLVVYKRYKEIRKIEQEMQAEIRLVEKKYLQLDAPLLKNISEIVCGERPIQAAEVKEPEKYLNEQEQKTVGEHLQARKIERYWSICLNNSSMVKNSMGKADEPLLDCIQNIEVVDEEGTNNFTIVFKMRENDIITNKVLTKKFYLVDDQPVKCESTPIEWVSKNLTMKEVKKKQKNKKTGQQRIITKQVSSKSFFNFFRSIEATPEVAAVDATEEQLKKQEELEHDFEVGGVIVDEIIPYSLQYYLGVSHDDQDDGDDDMDEEDDNDEDDNGGQKKKDKSSKSKSKSKSKGKDQKPVEKPDCKQQ